MPLHDDFKEVTKDDFKKVTEKGKNARKRKMPDVSGLDRFASPSKTPCFISKDFKIDVVDSLLNFRLTLIISLSNHIGNVVHSNA